tara:strand:+ start:445 stop:1482 length:1038 start_codon:yes stop_codon:yes gene_type:complete
MQIYKYVIKISKFADMKKIIFLFFIALTVFSSCETEFNVNSDWKEVMVIYGLLDQSQDKQYVRINKAFLGDQDFYVMAAISDSINYNPENLEVKIERISSSGVTLESKILTDTIMLKENGIFSVDQNIIYVFDTDDFMNQDKEYKLTVKNIVTDSIVDSRTRLIHDFNLMSSFNNPSYRMGFFKDNGDFSSSTVEWQQANNAGIYQVTLFVKYTEYSTTDTVVRTINKVYPVIKNDGNSDLKQKITGQEFLSLLKNNIDTSSTKNRRLNNLDILFSAGTTVLNTYIDLNKPPTGIVQERDMFTNINGGIGLFSARYNKVQNNIPITTTTKQVIAERLDSLNFIYP